MKKILLALSAVIVSSAFAAAPNTSVCLTENLDLFRKELLSAVADKQSFRSAAAEILYATEGDPKALAVLLAERVGSLDTAQLDKGIAKYGPELNSEIAAPLVRDYLQNMYFALATRRDLPPSVIQDKIGYGTDTQRVFRLAYVDRLRKKK